MLHVSSCFARLAQKLVIYLAGPDVNVTLMCPRILLMLQLNVSRGRWQPVHAPLPFHLFVEHVLTLAERG
jgi:hypothetical protein